MVLLLHKIIPQIVFKNLIRRFLDFHSQVRESENRNEEISDIVSQMMIGADKKKARGHCLQNQSPQLHIYLEEMKEQTILRFESFNPCM